MKISITRALTELKTLDARIKRRIDKSSFIAVVEGKNKVHGYSKNEDFINDVKSTMQSINDLINRRNQIKKNIVLSNAKTEVEIAGKKMTVAEAIERKNSIGYEKLLLEEMEKQYNRSLGEFKLLEERSKERLDEMLMVSYGEKTKVSTEQYKQIADPFLEQNYPRLIDPINLKEKIEELKIEIENFEEEVDFVLSESNATTLIDIPD